MATNEGPQLDAAPPEPEPPVGLTHPDYADLQLASQNYWAGRTGRESRPTPTLRLIDGKMTLGRYMDPYGCQALMRGSRKAWQKWYTPFFIVLLGSVIFGPDTDFIGTILAAMILAPWYFAVKAKYRRNYDYYFAVQAECLRTDQPQWVAYTKKELKFMDRYPPTVRP
jgi:hypothetical protein